jgi:peptidylprolyl isomerase
VRYTGWTTDGNMFDSSGSYPSMFRVEGLIKGFTEGLQLMVVGEKRRLWIPEPLAYRGERDPFGMLVFDVELVGIY